MFRHRYQGSSYPADKADQDAPRLRHLPLWLDTLLSGFRLLRSQPGDILVVNERIHPANLKRLQSTAAKVGVIVLPLPGEMRVHLEKRLKPDEDLGYRETGNLKVDNSQICGAKSPSGGQG